MSCNIVSKVKTLCEDASAYFENRENQKSAMKAAIIVAALVASRGALAGTGGEEFEDVWMTLTDWMQGTLGRVVSGAMVLVGIVGGVIRQSVMAFATGVGGGIGLYNTPKVIEAIMTATLSTPIA